MNFPTSFPPQHQNVQPGIEKDMNPKPIYDENYMELGNVLKDKVAIITGGDSGIGKAVAIAYAKQGADIVIVYLNEDSDANETKSLVDGIGRKCTLMAGDISDVNFCNNVIENTIKEWQNRINHYNEYIKTNKNTKIENTNKLNDFKKKYFS